MSSVPGFSSSERELHVQAQREKVHLRVEAAVVDLLLQGVVGLVLCDLCRPGHEAGLGLPFASSAGPTVVVDLLDLRREVAGGAEDAHGAKAPGISVEAPARQGGSSLLTQSFEEIGVQIVVLRHLGAPDEALASHLVELRRCRFLAAFRARHEVPTAHEEPVVLRLVAQEAERDQHEHVLAGGPRSMEVEELAKPFQSSDGAGEEAQYVQHLQPRAVLPQEPQQSRVTLQLLEGLRFARPSSGTPRPWRKSPCPRVAPRLPTSPLRARTSDRSAEPAAAPRWQSRPPPRRSKGLSRESCRRRGPPWFARSASPTPRPLAQLGLPGGAVRNDRLGGGMGLRWWTEDSLDRCKILRKIC